MKPKTLQFTHADLLQLPLEFFKQSSAVPASLGTFRSRPLSSSPEMPNVSEWECYERRGCGGGALMSNPTLGLPECTNNNSVERERNAAGAWETWTRTELKVGFGKMLLFCCLATQEVQSNIHCQVKSLSSRRLVVCPHGQGTRKPLKQSTKNISLYTRQNNLILICNPDQLITINPYESTFLNMTRDVCFSWVLLEQ